MSGVCSRVTPNSTYGPGVISRTWTETFHSRGISKRLGGEEREESHQYVWEETEWVEGIWTFRLEEEVIEIEKETEEVVVELEEEAQEVVIRKRIQY